MNSTLSLFPHPASLERVHELMQANQFSSAMMVLDAYIRVKPHDFEAWKTYFLIARNQSDLLWAKERMLRTRWLTDCQKADLLDLFVEVYRLLNQQLDGRIDLPDFWIENSTPLSDSADVQFELMYYSSASVASSQPRARFTMKPHRQTYNPLAEIAKGIIQTLAARPEMQRLTARMRNLYAAAMQCVEDPGQLYRLLGDMPQANTALNIGLFFLFALALRMAFLNVWLGYIILAGYVIGGWVWFARVWRSNVSMFSEQVRMYLNQSEELPVVLEGEEAEQEENSSQNP